MQLKKQRSHSFYNLAANRNTDSRSTHATQPKASHFAVLDCDPDKLPTKRTVAHPISGRPVLVQTRRPRTLDPYYKNVLAAVRSLGDHLTLVHG